MKKLLCIILILILLTGCTMNTNVAHMAGRDNAAELDYPYFDLPYVTEEQSLECCSEFLDLYGEEIMDFCRLFSEADPPVDNFYMMTYQGDTGDDVRYLIGEDMQKGNLEDYPLAEEIQAFCETFGCTDIEWIPNWAEEQGYHTCYFSVTLPVAELQDLYHRQTLIYCPIFTSHDIVCAVPDHEEWFVDFFEGV